MLGAIWAQSRNGVFGANGALPWDVPEDLRLFRALTLGTTVLMGRRTWDSLPRRPLPGRANVVLSGQRGLRLSGAEVVSSADDVEASTEQWWVIGGKGVLEALMRRIDVAVVTSVNVVVAGDVDAPTLDPALHQVRRFPDAGWLVSAGGVEFAVSEWRRATAPGLLPELTSYAAEAWGGTRARTRVIS
jgi:dihydrofolate reductase